MVEVKTNPIRKKIEFHSVSFDDLNREIPEIIQKQIDLQKKELAVREREIKLREVEIAEKEERFKNKSTDNTNNIEPIKIKINEDKTPVKLENNIHHDIVNVSLQSINQFDYLNSLFFRRFHRRKNLLLRRFHQRLRIQIQQQYRVKPVAKLVSLQ